MNTEKYLHQSMNYLQILCQEISNRSTGSEGNRAATGFFEKELASFGWETELQEFDAVDWEDGGASLQAAGIEFEVFPSPYSLGFEGEGELIGVSSIEELEQKEITGKLVLLHGEIAGEQLMPKNFVFYNPEEHQKIISLLERGKPKAILCATGRNAAVAGGVYPFPLIEDGDFDIPSVYMTDVEGGRLLPYMGKTAKLRSISRRIPGKGYNVTGRKGLPSGKRVVVTAHIDAKKGTPGAIDNATGVVILLLLADLLRDYAGPRLIEIAAFNGEDYYAVPGQMLYISKNQECFQEILLNINIDGAGYKEGKSALSFFGLPDDIQENALAVIDSHPGLTTGVQWVQGDHSMFVQMGIPAVAVTSNWFLENINSQEITHTPKDNIEIVDPQKLVEIAHALDDFIRKI